MFWRRVFELFVAILVFILSFLFGLYLYHFCPYKFLFLVCLVLPFLWVLLSRKGGGL